MQQIPGAATPLQAAQPAGPARRLATLLNRGLPPDAQVALRLRWPLWALPLLLAAQIAMSDPVWTTTGVVLIVIYVGALLWVRALARGLCLERKRRGTLLVVGDTLEEEFFVSNSSGAPAVWAAVIDESTLPGYAINRVVGVGAHAADKWRTTAVCPRRGLFRLGPHTLRSGDPLRLFTLTLHDPRAEMLLIHPRVVALPSFPLPRGYASGDARTRRPQMGTRPATSVRAYQPFDETRFIHWPSTAHRAQLMVRELDQEPTGDIWIVLDSDAAAYSAPQDGASGAAVFETAIIAAASLGAQFLEGSARRAVGLITATGDPAQAVQVAPAAGRGQLWRLLAALAPLEPAPLPLDTLLQAGRPPGAGRSSLIVVTAQLHDAAGMARWHAEMLRISGGGAATGLMLVTTPATAAAADATRLLLARDNIPVELLPYDAPLTPLLTHRRRRTQLRTTPSGGVVAVEVEEEVA